jgi:hypothetical protein
MQVPPNFNVFFLNPVQLPYDVNMPVISNHILLSAHLNLLNDLLAHLHADENLLQCPPNIGASRTPMTAFLISNERVDLVVNLNAINQKVFADMVREGLRRFELLQGVDELCDHLFAGLGSI